MVERDMRNWWITGVSSGLGRAVALAALRLGNHVAGTVRREEDRIAFEALAPGLAHGFLLDVTDHDAVHETAKRIETELGPIDIVVNNAGYGLVGAIEEASMPEIRAQFEVNVFGAIAVIQSALPYMRARRAGRIINITSVSGLAPWWGTGIYGASKFAMECIGQTLAEEVGPLGIKVTNVEPGGLRTEFAGGSMAFTARAIEDYEATAHEARRIFADHAGDEPGDPAKAALAILQIVEAEEPPLQLLLGADALFYVGRKLGAFHAETARWAQLSLSTAFDEND